MAYQTGSANNINDLFGKLETFAEPLGWVSDRLAHNQLCLHNEVGFWSLVFNEKQKELYCYANTGFDHQNDSGDSQPGSSKNNAYTTINTTTSGLDGGNYVSYDFFGTAQYLHVVVQYEANQFRHFGIGTLHKEGDYTGGQYAFGTYTVEVYKNYQSNNHCFGFSNGTEQKQAVVRADGISGDKRTPWYFAPKTVPNFRTLSPKEFGQYLLSLGRASLERDSNTYHPDRFLVVHSQSTFGNILIPCPHSLIVHGVDGVFRRLGVVPDRYECTMVGIFPRQILEINGERWMIIPSAGYDERNVYQIEKGKDNSGIQGVAYRMVE